ncbi:TolC family protein [Acidocella aromatica]|uniref:Outer membrane protein TolC n=1 Tax=Acidocella aromatica TaxID=1303579 RepID=A0A840VAZ7_9PROT|nr:TolC family protein [Acidocella aromatica]MBB5373088.1 outer membrane protein TolC [Acidocella aromatica]
MRFALSILVLCASLTACATYRPSPLPASPPLRETLAQLRHNLPDGGEISTAGPLALRDVAALAVLNDPDLIAARAQHDVSSAELLSAGLPPDPAINAGFAALLGGPASMSSISAGFMQDVGALITYRANRAAAKAGLAQVDAGILWQEWQVASQSEQLAVTLAADAAATASLHADVTVLADVNNATQTQIVQHNLTLNDAAASMAALAVAQSALNAAQQTEAHDRDQLDALLGLEPGTEIPLALPEATPPVPDAIAPALATLPQRRPDLIALRYGYAQADARLRAAILSQFLPVSVGASYGRDTSGVLSAGPQMSLTLPLFNRNRGGIAAAQATRAALSAQYAAALANAEGGARALYANILLLGSQAEIARHQADQAAVMAQSARTAFAEGQISATALANLQSTAGERERAAIGLDAQLQSSEISLATLLGLGLPPLAAAPKDLSP